MDDDDFWTTYIASTPDEDQDFALRPGCWLWAIVVLVALVLFYVIRSL